MAAAEHVEEDELEMLGRLKRENAELQHTLSFRNEDEDKELRKLFPELPDSEHVIDYFACALSSKILLQGWMYVTQNYICFSCNLFVFAEKRHFEIKDIKRLIKSRHAGMNPGFCITFVDPAIPKVGFFSFFDRDKVLTLLSRLQKAKNAEDDDGEEQEDYVYEDVVASMESVDGAAFPETKIPADESGFKNLVHDCELPLTPREAFALMYSDKSEFMKKQKEYDGCSELSISPWSTADDKRPGWVRELTFRYPLDGIPMCPPSTMVHEVQQIRLDEESDELVVVWMVQSQDVPYGTYFTVDTKQRFKPHGDGHCTLNISMEVSFSKSTFLEGKIRSNTISMESDRWKGWCDYARDFVEKKKGLKRTNKPLPKGGKKDGKDKEKKKAEDVRNVVAVLSTALLALMMVLLVEFKMQALEAL